MGGGVTISSRVKNGERRPTIAETFSEEVDAADVAAAAACCNTVAVVLIIPPPP